MKAGTLGFFSESPDFNLPPLQSARTSRKANPFDGAAVLRQLFQLDSLESPQSLDTLEKLGPPRFVEKILALSHEKDRQVFHHGIFLLAQELQDQGSPTCLALYASLLPLQDFSELAERAKSRLQSLRGEGPWGPRLSAFIGELLEQSADIPSLVGLLAGGIAYRTVKGGLASWMLAETSALRGWRFAASATGIYGSAVLSEAAVFNSSAKLAGLAIGRPVDFSQWGSDWASLAVFLGALRATGFGARQSGKALAQIGVVSPLAPKILHQSGLYLGILLGHQLQKDLGLAHTGNDSAPLRHAFTEWLHFNAASLVAARLTPKSLKEWEGRFDTQIDARLQKSFARMFEPPSGGSPSKQVLAVEGPQEVLPDTTYLESPWQGRHNEAPHASFSLGTPQGERLSPREQFRQALGAAASLKALETLDVLEMHFGAEGKLYKAFSAAKTRDAAKLELALTRVSKSLFTLDVDRAERNYADFAIAASITENYHRERAIPAEVIVKFYSEGGKISDLEAALAPSLAHLQLRPPPVEGSNLGQHIDVVLKIAQLPLSARCKLLLQQYVELYLNSQANLKPDPEKLIRRLDALQSVAAHPVYIPLLEKAFELAESSPLGSLRIGRLLRIAQHDSKFSLYSKLSEMGDPNFALVRPHYLLGLRVVTSPINGTQFNAYYDDPAMSRLFRRIYWDLNSMLDPKKSAERKTRREEILNQFWQNRPANPTWTKQEVISLLKAFGDRYSLQAAKDLKNERVSLEILNDEDFANRAVSARGEKKVLDSWLALYSPPGMFGPKGLITVRQPVFSTDPQKRNDQTFELFRSLVHEHRHSKNMTPNLRRTLDVVVKQEVDSNALDYYWAALHGDPSSLKRTLEFGSGGVALYLRHDQEAISRRHLEILAEKKGE